MKRIGILKLCFLIPGLCVSLFTQVHAVLWREDVPQSEVLKKAASFTSVVWIETINGHGSGVLIGPRTVLTAAHVAEGCKPLISTVIAHDEGGGEVRYPVLSVYYPESLTCTAISEGAGGSLATHNDIAILELLAPVDTSRFKLASFVGAFEDTRDLTSLLRSNYFVEFEGAGYGLWGPWGSEPNYPDGQRRYYQSRGSYDYDLDPETGLPSLETLSFAEYSNLGDKESLLPLSGVCKPGDSGSPVFDPESGLVFALCVNGQPLNVSSDDSEHNEFSGYVSLYPHLGWIFETRSHIEQMSNPIASSRMGLTYDLEALALDFLMENLESDNLETLEHLSGAVSINLNAQDSLGCYPLGLAIYLGDVVIAEWLLAHGANPNHDNGSGHSWLDLAVFTENTDLADLLRQWGALDHVEVDASSCKLAKEAEMLDYLLRYGEHSLSAFVASDPLAMALIRSLGSEDKFMARLLLKLGADWTREDFLNQTPLLGSISMYDLSTVNFLLENGVDPNIPDSKGRLPIIQAAIGGYDPIVEALLEYGVDPNTQDVLGRTPLYVALEPEEGEDLDESLLELLFTYGADVDKGHRYSAGRDLLDAEQPLLATALFDWINLDVVRWLLEHGANPNVRDAEAGLSLLSYSQELLKRFNAMGDETHYSFFKEAESLLIEYGATEDFS